MTKPWTSLPVVGHHGAVITARARYVDTNRRLWSFAELIHVVCPACGGRAESTRRPGQEPLRYYSDLMWRARRLVCVHCGANREWTPRKGGYGVAFGGPCDPFFALPLWLRTPCRGEVLWAYNREHLDVLAAFAGATLRERAPQMAMTMVARLPVWMKSATHRRDVLRGIARLRAMLPEEA